jgi:hypothetical protein
VWLYPALRPRLLPRVAAVGRRTAWPPTNEIEENQMQRGDAEHYRELAAHFRSLADVEPLPGLRRYLRQLAAHHDQVAADLDEAEEPTPRSSSADQHRCGYRSRNPELITAHQSIGPTWCPMNSTSAVVAPPHKRIKGPIGIRGSPVSPFHTFVLAHCRDPS